MNTELARFGLFSGQLLTQALAVLSTLSKPSFVAQSSLKKNIQLSQIKAESLVLQKDAQTLEGLQQAIETSLLSLDELDRYSGLSDADHHGIEMALSNMVLVSNRARALQQRMNNVVPFPKRYA